MNYEQRRAPQGSDAATLYLLASILCDVALLTTPSKPTDYQNTFPPIIFRCSLYLVLLVLECWPVPSALGALANDQSPEELRGALSNVLFVWINPILVRGYRNLLVNDDVPVLNQDTRAQSTRHAILHSWSERGQSRFQAFPRLQNINEASPT